MKEITCADWDLLRSVLPMVCNDLLM